MPWDDGSDRYLYQIELTAESNNPRPHPRSPRKRINWQSSAVRNTELVADKEVTPSYHTFNI